MVPAVPHKLKQTPQSNANHNAVICSQVLDVALNRPQVHIHVPTLENDIFETGETFDVDQNLPKLQKVFIDELDWAPVIEEPRMFGQLDSRKLY